MTEAEYDAWYEREIEGYAQDIARASGRPIEAARERARHQHAEFLPDGLATPGTWIMTVRTDDDEVVGTIWLGPHPHRGDAAFVYDIEIDESRRGEGLGRAAMLAAEALVRDAGLNEIGLNVFGFNEPAQRLYSSLGYRVVSTQMSKRLD
jgi:ribosomal protein S18 acetylase RimI-like enzyme